LIKRYFLFAVFLDIPCFRQTGLVLFMSEVLFQNPSKQDSKRFFESEEAQCLGLVLKFSRKESSKMSPAITVVFGL